MSSARIWSMPVMMEEFFLFSSENGDSVMAEGSGGVSFSGGFSEEVLVLLILRRSAVGGENVLASSVGFSEEVILLLLILLLPSVIIASVFARDFANNNDNGYRGFFGLWKGRRKMIPVLSLERKEEVKQWLLGILANNENTSEQIKKNLLAQLLVTKRFQI
ncbi:hypothetical protein H1P_4920007 [Hyella patelloides LEGE 07179]|uniref:Uncharacterized protein n=1 Tax=Hyella patelloides LEGE 07179 TaxID=945734 RepID=A0A563VZ82_9CYAN|nr:hypothetical protein H1P_4920007 [Hyella patelloides LEGE 07179]